MYIYTLYEKNTITKLHHMIKCNAFISCWFNFKKKKVPNSHQCMYTLYGKSTKTKLHLICIYTLYYIILCIYILYHIKKRYHMWHHDVTCDATIFFIVYIYIHTYVRPYFFGSSTFGGVLLCWTMCIVRFLKNDDIFFFLQKYTSCNFFLFFFLIICEKTTL